MEDLNLSSLNEIQPSPTPAGISKFGNVPVSYFSGQPNISIPLYTLKDKDLQVPLSLNYHAGGILVNERPGWCGQNWSLMAGGVVTRTQRGLADEQPTYGYLAVNEKYSIYNFNSSWYLVSVSTPAGGVIGFSYLPNEIRYNTPPRETRFEEPSGGCSVSVTSPTKDYMIVQEKLLHKVRTRLAEVTFTTEAREDLDGGLRLASVEVKSRVNDELLYDYRLSYDYYNSGSANQRLRLLTVSEVKDRQESCDDFTYYIDYNSDNIAAIGSYSLDHWGYQNGSVGSINSTMIPQFGGDRKPNRRSTKGLISKLTYPTGGYTEFDFETHHKETVTEVPKPYSAVATYESIPGGTDIYETDTLTINCGAGVDGGDDVDFSYRINFSNKEQPVARVLFLQQGSL